MESMHTINGKGYLIDIENNDIKTIFVMENSQKRVASYEELQEIITLLNEQLNNYFTKEKTDKLNLDSILAFIKDEIEKGNFKTIDDINKYLDTMELKNEDRDVLITDLKEYMEDRLKSNNPEMADYYKKFKEHLHKRREKNEVFYSSVEVSNGIAIHKMYNYNKITRKITEIDKKSFDYTETFKTDFLNPMSLEFAKDSPLTSSEVIPRGFLEADVEFTNQNNASLKYVNIERTYAYEIQKAANEVKSLNPDTIKENQELENSNSQNPENQLDNDLQRFDGLTEQEKNALQQEKGYTRVRKLENNNSGKIGRAYIVVCIVIAILLLVFVTFQIFNK